VDAARLRAFAGRSFQATQVSKRAFWTEQYRKHGPESTLRASDALREHLRAINPLWPSAAEREADLAHHRAQRALFDRIGDALQRR
jgi:hypothetical protein